jgi:hypothetical protein
MRLITLSLLTLSIVPVACAPESVGPHSNIFEIAGASDFDAKVTSPLAPPRVVVQFTGPG